MADHSHLRAEAGGSGTYEIKTPAEHFTGVKVEAAVEELLDGWLRSAERLTGTASDTESQRFGLVKEASKSIYLAVPQWDGEALKKLVDQVLTAARDTISKDEKLAERLTAVVKAVEELLVVPQKPADYNENDRPNAWDRLAEKLDGKFREIADLLREQGSVLAMMLSCQTVLGQLLQHVDSHDRMLLLLKDGELVAVALLETNGGVGDLLVKPEHLAQKIRGAGSVLMEYIVRRAKAKGWTVALLPLDSAALRVYTAWGFTSTGTSTMSLMVLKPAAADTFLERRKVFAKHVFE